MLAYLAVQGLKFCKDKASMRLPGETVAHLAPQCPALQNAVCARMQGVAMTIGKIAPAAGISWVVYEETRIMLKCADRPCCGQ